MIPKGEREGFFAKWVYSIVGRHLANDAVLGRFDEIGDIFYFVCLLNLVLNLVYGIFDREITHIHYAIGIGYGVYGLFV